MGVKFEVVSPFAGTVGRICFRAGEKVEEGDVIVTLTHNGITHDILSPVSGYTDSVEVEGGDQVIAGMILATIIQSNDA
ncbi:acetyl-CoA carboxylase biotin carboxyl carrier protein subunit [Brevibacillus marinus]|uniref:acetyl-CoA carboxylase biotin carboxyl carrier protein subunit n=1 Tax=Brevibacillus marinus TaxID=2496837 RepID=UPI0013DF89DA|nr:acetyl-CoA carboxylase biotin carboxyl carrier protein subunit [Brevibacillus marinus]